MPRPYYGWRNARNLVKKKDPMQVIRHKGEGIHFCVREMLRDGPSAGLNDPAQVACLQLYPDDLPEQARPILRHQGEGVSARSRIIIPFQAYRATARISLGN